MLLVVAPGGRNRLWQVLRLDALVGITVTGLIYVTLLRPLVDLSGVPRLTDIGFHYVTPIGAVLGWASAVLGDRIQALVARPAPAVAEPVAPPKVA